VSVILDRPFEKASGNYYAYDHDGRNALQIASVTEPEIVKLEGVMSIPDIDGDSITGVVDLGDYILIFQKHSVWRYDPEKLTLKVIGEKVGCVAPHTLKKGKMGVYWLSDGGTICRMNRDGGVSVINGQILQWMLGYGRDCEPHAVGEHPVDYDHIDQACAVYDMPGDSYIIAFPRGDSGSSDHVAGYNTLVFKYSEPDNFWSRKCYAKTAGAITTNYMRIYTMFTGGDGIGFCGYHGLYSFDGTSPEDFIGNSKIPWGLASSWMSEANPERQKLIKRIAISNTPTTATLAAAVETTATMRFQKDRLSAFIPSFQSVSGIEARTMSTTLTTVLLHAGVRALVWRFVLEGYGYLCISDINTELRPKETPAEAWGTV